MELIIFNRVIYLDGSVNLGKARPCYRMFKFGNVCSKYNVAVFMIHVFTVPKFNIWSYEYNLKY